MEWTPSATDELDRLLYQARGLLGEEGADPQEVGEDIRHHIETEMQAADATVVTADDVRRLLQAMGVPVLASATGEADEAEEAEEPVPAASATKPRQTRVPRRGPRPPYAGLVLFGMLLPLLAIVVELSSKICATSFFDPLPTIGHVFLFGSIIVGAFALCAEQVRRPRLVGWLSGFAVGAAILYSLRFLPILPISLFAVVIGFGFLSLSPYIALAALGRGRAYHEEKLQADGRTLGSIWWGIGAAVLFTIVIEVSPALTRLGLQMAVDSEPATRARGVSLLRGVGSDDQLLRACYQRSNPGSGIFSWVFAFSKPPTTVDARRIYYRVTGLPFNAVPPPRMRTRSDLFFEDLGLDWSEQGGDAVGGRVRGLRLASSRLDGSIDTVAALAYTEWTLEFENLSPSAQEARAQIALPPGGVVSRLTLWVNGVEREAVFASRGHVAEAYREIAIRQRRDPVLVRTSGPDRILVQCFPVPIGGERMKIRLGITAPLELDSPSRGGLGAPSFVERNFDVPAEEIHAVWWESHAPIRSANEALRTEHPEDDVYAVRGSLRDADLVAGRAWIDVERSPQIDRAWTLDPKAPVSRIVTQRLLETEGPRHPAPHALAIVIDGSRLMQGTYGALGDAIQNLPEGIELHVIVAREEEPEILADGRTTTAASLREIAGLLSDVEARGGSDAVPALERACDAVAAAPGGQILWVLGPQPVELQSPSSLTQRFDRRPESVRVVALQAVAGPNRVLESFDGYPEAVTLSRRGDDVSEDLGRLFRAWRDARPGVRYERRRMPSDRAFQASAKRTSLHLAKLWANDEVRALLANTPRPRTKDAQALGTAYQVVTPVTGAVVLETDAQYERAGLLPPDEDAEVPTIPEPETWALMIAVALLLIVAVRGRRRRRRLGEAAA